MADFVRVAARSDIPEEGVLGVEANGLRICLADCEGAVYAFEDKCSHRDFPLSTGELDADDCTISCSWHGAVFDLQSGRPQGLPATRPILTFECRLEGDDVLVALPDS